MWKYLKGSCGYSLTATGSGATALAHASRSFEASPWPAMPSCSGEKATEPHASRIFLSAFASKWA